MISRKYFLVENGENLKIKKVLCRLNRGNNHVMVLKEIMSFFMVYFIN